MATTKQRPVNNNRIAKPPLKEKQLKRALQPRKPKKIIKNFEYDIDVLVAASKKPEVVVESIPEGRGDDHLRNDGSGEKIGNGRRIKIRVKAEKIGQRVFPPNISGKLVPLPKTTKKMVREARAGLPDLDGHLPDHLPLNPIPEKLAKELRVRRFIGRKPIKKNYHRATTIFPPEDRYTFSDTSFPWCTVGRVDTAGGQASGVLVGPRHLLTVSHAMVWNSDNSCGWVRFRPSYFDGNAPFGDAWAIRWYAYKKVYGPTLSRSEGRQDYVVLVLDRRIGDTCGWMGSRTYSDSWDHDNYWRHIGYPGDMAAGQRPSYERDISLDGSFWDSRSHQRIWHQGDVWVGQSGGPFFAWWSGESWPRVVAVQSGENTDENSASGGSRMVRLIIDARDDHP